jgi:hypothetical protein
VAADPHGLLIGLNRSRGPVGEVAGEVNAERNPEVSEFAAPELVDQDAVEFVAALAQLKDQKRAILLMKVSERRTMCGWSSVVRAMISLSTDFRSLSDAPCARRLTFAQVHLEPLGVDKVDHRKPALPDQAKEWGRSMIISNRRRHSGGTKTDRLEGVGVFSEIDELSLRGKDMDFRTDHRAF